MSRNIQAATTSASYEADLRFRLLVDVSSVTGGTTRACNGRNFIAFAGNTYSPVGYLGGMDAIKEESDLFARGVTLWFAAVSTTQIQDVLGESLFNCPVRIMRAFLNDSLTIVASAETLFRGFVETCEIKLKDPARGDHFTIQVESRLARPPRAQYFDRETLQNILGSSGDTFFDFTHLVPSVKGNWGPGHPVRYSDYYIGRRLTHGF